MFAFREAARQRDAQKVMAEHEDGIRVLSGRSAVHRRGAAEKTLRADLIEDLSDLMDTVNLASTIDLAGKDYVAGSVLNFGILDFSYLSTDSSRINGISQALQDSLVRHEPRLIPESVAVERRGDGSKLLDGQLSFMIAAEMRANPIDIPVEFVARIDSGLGKITLPDADAQQ